MSVFSLRAVKVYRTSLKAFKFCPTTQKILTQFLFRDILLLPSAESIGRLSFDCLSDILHSAFLSHICHVFYKAVYSIEIISAWPLKNIDIIFIP